MRDHDPLGNRLGGLAQEIKDEEDAQDKDKPVKPGPPYANTEVANEEAWAHKIVHFKNDLRRYDGRSLLATP